jgi:ketosteroid isomerase-like protein
MISQLHENLISRAYERFNARDIETVLSLMHSDVLWPNGWEGGYVKGHSEVRDYWTRQWKEIDPVVTPLSFKERQDGQIEVEVHQIAKDIRGNLLFDGIVKHIYIIEKGKITSMEIEKV